MSDWGKVAGQMAMIGLPSLSTALGGLVGTALLPGIGTAGGSALGSAIGKAAAQAIGSALGVPPVPEAIAAKIEADPDGSRVALAQIDAETQRQIAELQDVQNARAMLVSLEQTNSASGKAPALLSIVGLSGFFLVTLALFFIRQEIPTSVLTLLTTIVGVLVAIVSQIFNFWLGSSRSSQKKDAQFGAAMLVNSTTTGQR